MENRNKYAVMLAALIHDIHKVLWRLPDGYAGSETDFAVDFYRQTLSNNSEAESIKEEVFDILRGDEDLVQNLLSRADQMEKDESEAGHSVKRKPLLSVLSLVETVEKVPEGIYFHKPSVSSIEAINAFRVIHENELPTEAEMIELSEKSYENLVTDILSLPDLNLPQLIETLLFLYEKHLSSTSSAIYDKKPDISLFDHLKTTAALASCINEAEDGTKPFLIVAADMSGIQNFIYSETNPIENSQKGRSKQFRGKSFYLTLLTETFSSYLLDQTGMTSANLLINGGGHFVMVVPNSSENKEKLIKGKQKIQKWFFSTFKGELNLILETLEADDSLYKNFSRWYGTIANKLMAAKKQKSREMLSEVFSINLDGAERLYPVNPKGEEKETYENLAGYEKFLYSLTEMFSDIGMILPKAEFLIRKFVPSSWSPAYNPDFDLVEIPFPKFGITWGIAADKKNAKKFISDGGLKSANVYNINSFALPETLMKETGLPTVSSGVKLLGNQAPMNQTKDAVLEFQEIALSNKEDKKEIEYSALSVLRMDVDNLGSIFSFGLDREDESESIKSLSRTVNLSRALNLFFTGHINLIAQKWDIYVTYSGGDDLFVVGSWINTLNFAFDLKKKFTAFACGNKNLTISGGSYLCKDSYPIHKAAKHAGEAENKAKKSSPAKDSISLFGKEFRWDHAEELVNYGRELDKLVQSEKDDEKVSASYIHFLLGQTTTMLNDDKTLNIDKYFKNMFKIKYSLARSPRHIGAKEIEENAGTERPNKKVTLLSRLVNHELSKGLVEDFVVPASYVILKNRKNK
ncbi:type III-A CRISPR-associated protein Cas10/Csm1 [Ignavibacteriales bacterium]